jgi:bacillithiol system protein YtxJ
MKSAWKKINSENEVDDIISSSTEKNVLIFKYSTICPISKIVEERMDENTEILSNHFEMYKVAVIEDRPISNYIATATAIKHESPQVLLLKNGGCVFNESHLMIKPLDLLKK